MDEAIKIVLSAVIGAAVSYFLAQQQFRLKIDESTRTDREKVYKILWRLTGLLPRYPPAEGVTYDSLEFLSRQFRAWYFGEQIPLPEGNPAEGEAETPFEKVIGGIYLSEHSRKTYFAAQEMLIAVYEKGKGTDPTKPPPVLSDEDYEKARKKLSDLRAQLAKDIGSRRAPGDGEARFS